VTWKKFFWGIGMLFPWSVLIVYTVGRFLQILGFNV